MENGFESDSRNPESASDNFATEPDWSTWQSLPDRWRQNHGTLLMAFAGFVFLFGIGVLTYRQNRFRPPSFPNAATIQTQANPDRFASPEMEAAAMDEDGNVIENPERFLVRIIGAIADQSTVRVALYDSEDSFNQPDLALMKVEAPVRSDGTAIVAIALDSLPTEFAIAAFYDADGDGQLSRSAFGIPKERYGFSNDARGKFGPPSYKEAMVEKPDAPEKLLDIRIY